MATGADEAKHACVICGDRGVPRPFEHPHDGPGAAAASVPLPTLCDTHWDDVQSDWILLGWCTDHYGEALRRCEHHGRDIEPL